jgi:hypothetical protein
MEKTKKNPVVKIDCFGMAILVGAITSGVVKIIHAVRGVPEKAGFTFRLGKKSEK